LSDYSLEYHPSEQEVEFFVTAIQTEDPDDPFNFDGYIPGWAAYTAIDSNGDIYAYSEKPIRNSEYWSLRPDSHGILKLLQAGDDYCPDWVDSLRHL
jgi:hypothetical protein